ncbi:hypothetical protein [Priestia aryabhattai]
MSVEYAENTFQIEVEETGQGYDIKILECNKKDNSKLSIKDFNSLAEVFHFIENYSLKSHFLIQSVTLLPIRPNSYSLTFQEESFLKDIIGLENVKALGISRI